MTISNPTDPAMRHQIIEALSQPFGSYMEILTAWARAQPDATALRDDRKDIAWAELIGLVERLAARMIETGLERGQSVAILGASSVEYALAFLAAVRAGGVAAPLTTSASREQLEGMAKDSGAIHLLIDKDKAAELGPNFMSGMVRVPLEEIEGWMAPAGSRAPAFHPAQKDPFNIIYSSGTTGIPKGIVHSHVMRWRQFGATALSYLSGRLNVRSLASTPLYSNTTMVAFLAPLLAGGTVRIMGKFDCARWLEYAQADKSTVTMLVPVQYQRLMDFAGFDGFDLSSLVMKYCTSAPFSAELKREVLNRMPGGLVEIYSMTEGGVVCLLQADQFPNKLHTVGRPAPGSEIKVLDDEDREVPAGTAGNLVGRSHTMMSGYKNRPNKTAEAQWIDPDGGVWMRMGDIGRVDADGFVELVGRAKDMIISGGFNIYPSDLEAELEAHDAVSEAAVVGIPSRQWGETPVGFVVLREGAPGAEEVLDAVNARLGKTQRLSALYEIEEMPRSHIGKLLKTELREKAKGLAQEM